MNTLTVDFTTGVLDPRITFARALNTATVINSSGYVTPINADLPRFDYDPITLAPKGLLIEEARTNILNYSNNFNDASWTRANTTVSPDSAIGPDGLMSADKLIGTVGLAQHSIAKAVAGASLSTTYTHTMYAKAAEFSVLAFRDSTYGDVSLFNLANGTFTKGTRHTCVITPVGNSWYRCAVSVLNNTATINPVWSLNNFTATDGDGVSGLFIWGAQTEIGAFASTYIPTTTTALTRNADVATITGTNFSDWWQASKGGVVVRARPGTVSGVRPWVQFDDGTAKEIIALRGNATNPELYIVDGGTPQAQIDAGSIAANTDYSLTGWWAINDCKARLDSGAVVADTSATIPTVTQARIGSNGTNYLNGHIYSLSYYDSFSDQIYTRRKNKAVFNLM